MLKDNFKALKFYITTIALIFDTLISNILHVFKQISQHSVASKGEKILGKVVEAKRGDWEIEGMCESYKNEILFRVYGVSSIKSWAIVIKIDEN